MDTSKQVRSIIPNSLLVSFRNNCVIEIIFFVDMVEKMRIV